MTERTTLFRMNRPAPNSLSGDLFGGVTAAIVALPLAVAFGVASGAGPMAGLYGAICVGFFAALFGGTPTQISGPTGPITIVTASVFTQYAGEPAMAFTVVMMAGLFQILLGALRIGRFINLMPYPVISGFMTGIGCIIVIMQLEPLLGYTSPTSVVSALGVLPDGLSNPNMQAVLPGLLAFAICIWTPARIGRWLPPPLIALVVGSLMVAWFGGAPTLEAVPSAWPEIQTPRFSYEQLGQMMLFAMVVGTLGAIDSLLTSLVADNVTRTFHDSDKELVGQGLGNLIAGVLGGIAGAGATIRTLANIKAGGASALSGMIHAIILLAFVFGLGPAAEYIPLSVLAGILLKVGIDVVDWRFLKRLPRAPRADQLLMIVVLFLTVFVDVITAVGIGVVMASLVFVKASAELQIQSIKAIADPEHAVFLTQEESDTFARCNGRLLLLHLSGLISFGAASELTRRIARVGGYDVLLIDLSDVPQLDGTAALALDEIIERAESDGREIMVVGLNFHVARLLGKLGVLERIRDTSRFSTRAQALEAAAQHLQK